MIPIPKLFRLKSVNGCDVTKWRIIDVTSNSIDSGRNSDVLTSIIAQMITSRRLPDLCHSFSSWPRLNLKIKVKLTHMFSEDDECLEGRSNVKHKAGVVPEVIDRPLIPSVEENWPFAILPPFIYNENVRMFP